jgi:hypothetical protein
MENQNGDVTNQNEIETQPTNPTIIVLIQFLIARNLE